MEVRYTDDAQNDIKFWKRIGNVAIQNKISKIIDDIVKHPYIGLGKPEPLKYQYSGYWSRRITQEHRIVYIVENNEIKIMSLKGHYEK